MLTDPQYGQHLSTTFARQNSRPFASQHTSSQDIGAKLVNRLVKIMEGTIKTDPTTQKANIFAFYLLGMISETGSGPNSMVAFYR